MMIDSSFYHNEYNLCLSEYYDRDRIVKELNNFYKYTASFRYFAKPENFLEYPFDSKERYRISNQEIKNKLKKFKKKKKINMKDNDVKKTLMNSMRIGKDNRDNTSFDQIKVEQENENELQTCEKSVDRTAQYSSSTIEDGISFVKDGSKKEEMSEQDTTSNSDDLISETTPATRSASCISLSTGCTTATGASSIHDLKAKKRSLERGIQKRFSIGLSSTKHIEQKKNSRVPNLPAIVHIEKKK